jgi:hypothetical protein
MKSFFSIAFLVFSVLYVSGQPGTNTKGKWVPLFNGKNLNGWDVKIKGYDLNDNFGNTFRVEDGMMKVRYDKYDKFDNRFGHIFYKGTFSHYRIRVEYRFVGEQCPGGAGWAFRNIGIMVHGQPASTMEKDQDFPVSIEVQLLGGSGKGERSTANVCTPGTNIVMGDTLHTQHCTNSSSKTYNGDQWVTVEVEVDGGKVIRHFVDGLAVLEYTKPQLDPKDKYFKKLLPPDNNIILTKGSISLQGESHPCDFRKVEIMVLD